MDKQEEKIAYLKSVFQKALGAGKCRTLKEFAELVGINKSGLSSAMNGSERHLTDSLVARVRRWEQYEGLDKEPYIPKPEEPVTPSDFKTTMENLSSVLASQARLLETQARMLELYQQQTAAPHTATAEKIFTTDGRRK